MWLPTMKFWMGSTPPPEQVSRPVGHPKAADASGGLYESKTLQSAYHQESEVWVSRVRNAVTSTGAAALEGVIKTMVVVESVNDF